MRKKLLFLIIFTIYLFILSFVEGIFNIAASNAAPTPTTSNTQQIKDQLIENIASRVAELKLVEKRGFIGTVTDTSNTQITVSDIKNNTRFIDVDELTKFSSPLTKGSFGISDITKGASLGMLGLYNKQSRRLLARFVNVIILPKFIHGHVSEIDSKNYTLIIAAEKGRNITVDVGNTTKILSYSKDIEIARSSFSKIERDESVIIIGFTDLKNQDIIIAKRIILFPDLPKTPKPNETTIPSTGSGTITPITR